MLRWAMVRSFAWAMVGQDFTGTLTFFASRWGMGSTPLIAEGQALVWAAKIALILGGITWNGSQMLYLL